MPSKTRTHNASKASNRRTPRPAPASTPETPAANTSRTNAEDKLLAALQAHPNTTASHLSSVARIGKSTTGKILARWANDGTATRTPGIAGSGRRPADLWVITSTTTPAKTTTATTAGPDGPDGPDGQEDPNPGNLTETDDADTDSLPTAAPPEPPTNGNDSANTTPTAKAPRLAPGGLRGLVEDHLRDHPDEEFTPTKIGKALNRSSGAVHNALEKLIATGYAIKTNDAPKRFTLAPTERSSATGSAEN